MCQAFLTWCLSMLISFPSCYEYRSRGTGMRSLCECGRIHFWLSEEPAYRFPQWLQYSHLQWVSCQPSSCKHLLLYVFSIRAFLARERWNIKLVLIYMVLMSENVESLNFYCLLFLIYKNICSPCSFINGWFPVGVSNFANEGRVGCIYEMSGR